MTAPAPLFATSLSELSGIRHAFFTRKGGVSSGVYESLNLGAGSKDDPDAVEENRRRAAAFFGAPPTSLLLCRQVHSAAVARSDAFTSGRPEADGVVTASPGAICGALAADCAPILLADEEARVVGAAHAGWKGALAGVAEAAVRAMQAQGADAARITAVIGPCIGPGSYEVGLEFLYRFEAEDPGADRFFGPGLTPEKRLFDLPAYVLSRLARAGVVKASWIGRDTVAEPDLFFSNRLGFKRGDKDYGRLLSAIALV